jgi:hypothetical protein
MRTARNLVILFLGFCSAIVLAVDLPLAPEGFAWQQIPEVKAAFLKPQGWFFKREEQKDTLAYFITKESIDQSGAEFKTGLSINVFRKLKKSKATDQAKYMIAALVAKYHVQSFERNFGSFYELGCELKDTDANGTIVMRELAVANTKTNTLYLFIFESPEAGWNTASKVGEQIMDKLALDDEI